MRGDVDYNRMIMYCALFGAVVGVIGSIPILRLPNLCCLWIVLGGFGAAYAVGRDARDMEAMDGVIVGGLFGLVYGVIVNVVTFLVNIPLNLLGFGNLARGTPGGGVLADLGIKVGLAGFLGGLAVVALNIVEGVVFGAVGGVIYAASRDSTKPVTSFFGKGSGKSALGKR
jgi:hypothetical protein